MQVVSSCQVVAREFLGEHGTAVTIDLDLAGIAEAGFPDKGIR